MGEIVADAPSVVLGTQTHKQLQQTTVNATVEVVGGFCESP